MVAVDDRHHGLAAAMRADERGQLVGGLPDEIVADRRQPFDYQEGMPRRRGQLGPLGLLPVPAAAEGAEVVPVDDLSGLRRARLGLTEEMDGRLAVGRLGARGDADLAWETALLQHLDREGLTVPVPIPTTDGRLFADGLVVMTYLEGGRPGDGGRLASRGRHDCSSGYSWFAVT